MTTKKYNRNLSYLSPRDTSYTLDLDFYRVFVNQVDSLISYFKINGLFEINEIIQINQQLNVF